MGHPGGDGDQLIGYGRQALDQDHPDPDLGVERLEGLELGGHAQEAQQAVADIVADSVAQ